MKQGSLVSFQAGDRFVLLLRARSEYEDTAQIIGSTSHKGRVADRRLFVSQAFAAAAEVFFGRLKS